MNFGDVEDGKRLLFQATIFTGKATVFEPGPEDRVFQVQIKKAGS
jgi:hypothetical protein